MYIWKTQKLAVELAKGSVGQTEQLKYFLATSVLFVFATTRYGDASEAAFFDLLAAIIITVGGIVYCYKNNSRGDSKDFILRMVCLGWPITVKLITIILASTLVLGVVLAELSPDFGDQLFENDYIWSVFIFLATAIYYWRLSVHLSFVAMYGSET